MPNKSSLHITEELALWADAEERERLKHGRRLKQELLQTKNGVAPKFCRLCGKEFIPIRRNELSCSRICHVRYKNKKKDGTLDRYDPVTNTTAPAEEKCAACGKVFLRGHWRQKYCNAKCHRIVQSASSIAVNIKRSNASIEYYLATKWRSIRNEIKNGARKGIAEFSLPEGYLLAIWEKQKGICALTGRKMTHIAGEGPYITTNVSVDRIDSARGYAVDNVRLVCRMANIMKHKVSDEELRQWCKWILEAGAK